MLMISGVRKSVVGLLGSPLFTIVSLTNAPYTLIGRERAAQRAVDDHHAHQQQIDPITAGEGHRQRRHDRHREQGADRRTAATVRKKKIHGTAASRPRTSRMRPLHQQVDGAVVLRQREQVGQTDEQQEQIAGEAAGDLAVAGDAEDDLVDRQPDRDGADEEGGSKGQHPEVDRQRRGDHEHENQDDDRENLGAHRGSPSVAAAIGARGRRHGPARRSAQGPQSTCVAYA